MEELAKEAAAPPPMVEQRQSVPRTGKFPINYMDDTVNDYGDMDDSANFVPDLLSASSSSSDDEREPYVRDTARL
jgi:hypothetical protein